MNSKIENVVIEFKKASIDKPRIVSPPTLKQIEIAENSLGINFPPSFKYFLEECGSYQLPFWETYWIGDEDLGYRNIIGANLSERNNTNTPLPDFLITFHNDGLGNNLCFDTRHPDQDGEYPIVFWDHELSSNENFKVLHVDFLNFTEWLLFSIRES